MMARFCPKCGNETADADRFCGNCGKPLSADAAGAPTVTGSPAAGAAMPAPSAAPVAEPLAPGPVATPSPTPTATPSPSPSVEDSPEMRARVDRVYRQVGDHLRAAEVKFMENTAERSYTALYGSAVAVVRVTPAGTDDTWVSFLAPVVSGARLEPELYDYLLRKNADYAATKFHINAANEIWIQYSILGSIIDAKTCKLAIFFTMITADNEDDAIRARWGGRPASEVLLGRAA
jgi:hypothetical protein